MDKFPLFTRRDSLDGIAGYVVMMMEVGVDVSNYSLEDVHPAQALVEPSEARGSN